MLKKSNEMQQYADIYLLLNYTTCFVRPSRPSSGVYKTVFISVINQLDIQNFCFTISLFHISTCFEHMCSKHVEA